MRNKFLAGIRNAVPCLLLAAGVFMFGAYAQATTLRTEIARAADVTAGTKNAVTLDYANNENGTLTVTVSIKGEVCFAGFAGILKYDDTVLDYSSSRALYTGVVLNDAEKGKFAFSFAAVQDVTTAVDMFEVTFAYSGGINTSLSLDIEEGDFSNAAFENVEYTVVGGNIVIEESGGDHTDSTDENSVNAGSSSSGHATVTTPSSSDSGCGASLKIETLSAGISLFAFAGTIVFLKKKKRG